VKRRDLLKELKRRAALAGLPLSFSEGGNHTKATVGNRTAPIPRHREISDLTASAIFTQLDLKDSR
jgi:hypothetical protein